MGIVSRHALAANAVIGSLFASGLSSAQERPVRAVAIGPSVGFYSGVGAAALLRPSPVGLAVSGGYMPVFVFGNEGESRAFRANYYSSLQLTADFVIGPVSRTKVDLSLLFGYRYNGVLGHGAGAGIAIEIPLSEAWGAAVLVAPSIFPRASDELEERGYPSDRDATIPWFQGGASVALWYYP